MKTWKKFKEDNNINLSEAETLRWGSLSTSERKELLKDVRLPSSFAKDSWKDLDFRAKEKLGKYINKTTMGEFRLDEGNDTYYEFPNDRLAKQFAKDIANAGVATGTVSGNRVIDLDFLKSSSAGLSVKALKKYLKQNRGKGPMVYKESVELDEKSQRFGGDTNIPASKETTEYIQNVKGSEILINVQSSLHPSARFLVIKNPNASTRQDKVSMATTSDAKRRPMKMFSFHGTHVSHQKAMDFAKHHKLVAMKDKDGNPLYAKEGFASDAQRRAAFASGYKAKGKKKDKKESVELGESTPAYRKMMKNYAKSDDKKVFDILKDKGWKVYPQDDTLVRNMLKRNKGNVEKTAAEIEKKYSNRFESVELGEERTLIFTMKGDKNKIVKDMEKKFGQYYDGAGQSAGSDEWDMSFTVDMKMFNKISDYVTKKYGKNTVHRDFFDEHTTKWHNAAKLEEGKYDSDVRIKKMSDKGKTILAMMANSFGETGGPYLDKNNVHNLTTYAIDRIVKQLKKIENKLPSDKKKEMALVMKELGEGIEEEMTTTTSVGTLTDPNDMGRRKKKKKELSKYTESQIFTVSSADYNRCIKGRKKNERWNKFFTKESEMGAKIKKYSLRNPNAPIVIKNEETGDMMYLRRRLNDQRLRHNRRR